MSMGHYTNEEVTLSTSAKTTLPKQARNFLDVEEGDKISFKITENERVVVEKVEQDD